MRRHTPFVNCQTGPGLGRLAADSNPSCVHSQYDVLSRAKRRRPVPPHGMLYNRHVVRAYSEPATFRDGFPTRRIAVRDISGVAQNAATVETSSF